MDAGQRMRLFFGVPVDEVVRERVAELQQQLKSAAGKVNWVQPANYHFTLRFIGEVAEDRVEATANAADKAWESAKPGRVVLRGCGAFPNPRSPRVVWVGVVEGAEVIRGLEEPLSAALKRNLRIAREDRKFVAHLTIGRVRVPRRDPGLEQALGELAQAEAGEFDVRSFVLYQSILRPGGPIYQPVRVYEAPTASKELDG